MYAKAMIGIKSWLEPPLTHIRLKTVYDRNINSYGSQKKKNSQDCQECLGNAALFFWGPTKLYYAAQI